MNIPETVKIAGYRYTVERPNTALITSGIQIADGQHDGGEHKIIVVREGNEAYQNTVFLHELVHGIISSYCRALIGDRDEEDFVRHFAVGLYQVIVDNPEIFDNLATDAVKPPPECDIVKVPFLGTCT